MALKMGKSKSRAGTGTIDETTTGVKNWGNGIVAKTNDIKDIKSDLVKQLPIKFIKTDQDNPRKLEINVELVEKIAEKFPIALYLQNETDNDWIEEYVEKVEKEFELKGKQINDFKSIVQFGATLKSPDRLLHSIVVWKDDSIFHLISGERRVLTHAILGSKTISAKILLEKPSKKEIDILQWDENIHRENMSIYEKIERVRKFVDNQFSATNKVSVRKLAKLSGLGKTDAERYLSIIRFPTNSLIEAIKDGKITSLHKANDLSKLSEEDLDLVLKGEAVSLSPETEKKITKTQSIKISKTADNLAMQKMINAVAENFEASELIKELDLTKQKDVNTAFNILLEYLTEAE